MYQARTIRSAVIVLLIALPWLNPFATGPAPSVGPLIFSWACVGGLLLMGLRPGASQVAYGWLSAGLASSAIGLLQYVGADAVLSPWVNQTDLGQAFANLRQRNQFATLTVLALAAVVWRKSRSLGVSTSGRFHGDMAMAAILAIGTAASSSRTGLAQLILLCLLTGLWGTWRQASVRRVLAVALASYALSALVLPLLVGLSPADHGIFARLAAGDQVCSSRTTLWANVLHLISLRPWTGWGLGELDFAHYVSLYPGDRFCDILDNAHNLPLHVAVEAGIPVTALLLVGSGWLVVRSKPWRESEPGRQLAWAALCLIGIHSLLEYPLWYGPFQVAGLLCLVLLWPQQRALQPWTALPSRALGIVIVMTCVYGAWDYRRISQIYLPVEQRAAAYRENTLEKIRASWLFQSQVRFAELTTTPLTPRNAEQLNRMAHELLHFSPEPRVIEKLIESAVMLGRDDEAQFHLARFKAAFPDAHAKWAATFMPPR